MIDLYSGDCLDIMPQLPDKSIDLILTDPPYFKVKNESWDRQWNKPEGFINWLDSVLAEYHRLLKSNGSLYLFASPKMSAQVEVLISSRFNVLNCVRWEKEQGWHQKQKIDDMRKYQNPWESCIFAEHKGAESYAKGEAGYNQKCDELRSFVFEPLRKYICDEYERAGMLNQSGKIATNVACGFSASSGGMASRHYFSRSQWYLPTEEHYMAMKRLLNRVENGEYLRREYEELRREYEELRRPFYSSAARPVKDVWRYQTVKPYPGKHPCEKPMDMLVNMIATSSRPDATVLDTFMGTGSTGVACRDLCRKFIGIEKDEHYFNKAKERIQQPQVNDEQLDLPLIAS